MCPMLFLNSAVFQEKKRKTGSVHDRNAVQKENQSHPRQVSELVWTAAITQAGLSYWGPEE